ncbi:MAG: hypothetical protein NZ529_06720 [Cytophagaceae bacterium]|nr:hypothetical protein [Cytophagaceae bacterium]MDW8456473.1 inositol monophosphatase family protein [Cytophagaceae bacterium]
MEHERIKDIFIQIGEQIRDQIYDSLKKQSTQHELSTVYEDSEEDVIYLIDKRAEDLIIKNFEMHASELGGVVLIGEGIGNRKNPKILPSNFDESTCRYRIIIDPIDGTRGIMYDKRSAFFLAGAAVNKGYDTMFSDIEVSVMVELPTSRAAISDVLWAIKGKGAHAYSVNLLNKQTSAKEIRPSKAQSIEGGFAIISKFFPQGKKKLATIEEELLSSLFPEKFHKISVFDDQYISSGGQLYELLMGHDRFVADIRKTIFQAAAQHGEPIGHCCHPYDISAHLIGIEAGIIITDVDGNNLNCPLDTTENVDWLGFANQAVYRQVYPALYNVLKKSIL